jgi:hypothetical protein
MAKNPLQIAQELPVLSTTYVLKADPDQPVFLSIEIGDDGQTGESTVTVGTAARPVQGSESNIFIGTTAELEFTTLFVTTVVQDVSPDHNHATLTLTLSGGVTESTFNLGKVVSEGGSGIFKAQFLMFKF